MGSRGWRGGSWGGVSGKASRRSNRLLWNHSSNGDPTVLSSFSMTTTVSGSGYRSCPVKGFWFANRVRSFFRSSTIIVLVISEH
jgi:hypothetical protein